MESEATRFGFTWFAELNEFAITLSWAKKYK